MSTTISWVKNPDGTPGEVWPVVSGCTKKSEGCRNCWACALHTMRHEAKKAGKKLPEQYAKPFNVIQLHPERLDAPLHWNKPRTVFVCSSSDLFHEDVPDEFLPEVFAVMAIARQHTFMVLTKRPERMREVLDDGIFLEAVGQAIVSIAEKENPCIAHIADEILDDENWPLPNVWLGVSVEHQAAANHRIPLLLQTPAAHRFVSCAPLLGPVKFHFDESAETAIDALNGVRYAKNEMLAIGRTEKLDLVIVEGESGEDARPMNPKDARRMRDQCREVGVKFHFKQWGEWLPADQLLISELAKNPPSVVIDGTVMYRVGKRRAGRLLDGREWLDLPV